MLVATIASISGAMKTPFTFLALLGDILNSFAIIKKLLIFSFV
jgi:hypothetical protein